MTAFILLFGILLAIVSLSIGWRADNKKLIYGAYALLILLAVSAFFISMEMETEDEQSPGLLNEQDLEVKDLGGIDWMAETPFTLGEKWDLRNENGYIYAIEAGTDPEQNPLGLKLTFAIMAKGGDDARTVRDKDFEMILDDPEVTGNKRELELMEMTLYVVEGVSDSFVSTAFSEVYFDWGDRVIRVGINDELEGYLIDIGDMIESLEIPQ